MTYTDGSYFVGDFSNNEIQGEGVFTTIRYIARGNWLNGYLEGMGSQKYND